jgi:hypothetical protein
MKVCPLCGKSYHPFVDFCFADGEVLTVEETVSEVPEPEGFDAPPPPKMLQGSQQSTGYTRSATPVPRARRPGRTLVNRPDGSGGGVYSPPAAPDEAPVAHAASPPAPVSASNLYADAEDEEVLEAPPMVDPAEPSGTDVEEVASYDPSFESPEEPRPEPLLDQGVPDDEEDDRAAAVPPRGAPPVTADPVLPPVQEEEASTLSLVVAGLAVLLLLGLVGAAAAVAVGTMMSGDDEDDSLTIPEPVPDPEPDPTPVQEPEPAPDPVTVGTVPEPEGVEPDPEPDVQPEPVGEPEPEVRPTPEPDGVAVVQPRPVAKIGSVLFRSTPDRAMIYLDDTPIGTTNFEKKDVRYGEHTLRLEKEGFETLETTFRVNAPSVELAPYSLKSLTAEPEPDIEPTPAPVEVKNRPEGTPRKFMFFHEDLGLAVQVDGSTQGCELEADGSCVTPATYNLPPGNYTVNYNSPAGPKSCPFTVEDRENMQMMRLHVECN